MMLAARHLAGRPRLHHALLYVERPHSLPTAQSGRHFQTSSSLKFCLAEQSSTKTASGRSDTLQKRRNGFEGYAEDDFEDDAEGEFIDEEGPGKRESLDGGEEEIGEEEARRIFERREKRRAKKEKALDQKMKQLPVWLQRSVPVDALPEAAQRIDPSNVSTDTTFGGLGIKIPSLEKLMREEWRINKPTRIQALAIPLILEGRHVFAADQTGTGKTLSYLLPILQILKDQEKTAGYRRRGQHARAIVLVPTRELVEQVMKALNKIVSDVPEFKHMNVHGMAGGLSKPRKEFMWLNKGVDILVATAERISFHLDKKHLELTDTQTIVVDEADTLFGVEVYRQQIMHLIYLCRKVSRLYSTAGTRATIQYVWVSATVSKEVAQYISKEFPESVQTFSDTLHKSVSGLKQDFLFGSSGKWKERLLFDTLKKYKGKRTMVFCNTIEKAKYVFNMLESSGYKVGLFTSDMNRDRRSKTFEGFDGGDLTILVTTDIGSRGLDMKESVDHVILYDFPLNAIDYLHRIGRTARAGKQGIVTSFCGSKDQTLVQQIREAYVNDVSLTDVKPSHSQKPKRRRRVKEIVDERYLQEEREMGGDDMEDRGHRAERREEMTEFEQIMGRREDRKEQARPERTPKKVYTTKVDNKRAKKSGLKKPTRPRTSERE